MLRATAAPAPMPTAAAAASSLASLGRPAAASRTSGPLVIPAPVADQDPNVEVLREGERIQKLTRAADALVVRDYVLREEEATLDDLEASVAALEADVTRAMKRTDELQRSSSLLRPGAARGSAGENAEVSALWFEYGPSMSRLVAKHSKRVSELERALATASFPDAAGLLQTPKPLPAAPPLLLGRSAAAAP